MSRAAVIMSWSGVKKILELIIFISYLNGIEGNGPGFGKNAEKPNIIFILADDLGWNEVSWHNNRIKTPFLEVSANINLV